MSRIAIALLLACGGAAAQNVVNVDSVVSRSTMLLKDGRYTSCGLRFVGVPYFTGNNVKYPTYTFDMNVTIMRFDGSSLAALHKAEMSVYQNLSELQSAKGRLKKIRTTWIQAEGKEAWSPHGKGIAGENGLSSMTGYPAVPVFDYLVDAAAGQAGPLLLGISLADERAERIYRFTPKIEKADADAFSACTNALIEQAKREAPSR